VLQRKVIYSTFYIIRRLYITAVLSWNWVLALLSVTLETLHKISTAFNKKIENIEKIMIFSLEKIDLIVIKIA
jgi:hypothetical protein